MDYLDEGVLTEILLRLPAQSLLRFKCVSRLWHSVISDPEFAKAQLRMSLRGNPNPSEKLLVPVVRHGRDSLDESIFTTLSDPRNYLEGHFSIQGSCHGLVCLQDKKDCGQLFVYNPTTRESRKLPMSGSLCYGYAECVCAGFGYDTLKDDYKLLFIYPQLYGSQVEICSLRSNSCRIFSEVNRCDLQGHGRYSNGFLHWVSRKSKGYTIVSFDVATEEFHEGLLPMPSFRLLGGRVQLSVTGGGTLVVYRTKWPTIEAWIMKDPGLNSTWTELCLFSNDRLMNVQAWNRNDSISPLIKDGKALLCVRRGCHSVGIYDPMDDSLKTFEIPLTTAWKDINMITTYVESLVSV